MKELDQTLLKWEEQETSSTSTTPSSSISKSHCGGFERSSLIDPIDLPPPPPPPLPPSRPPSQPTTLTIRSSASGSSKKPITSFNGHCSDSDCEDCTTTSATTSSNNSESGGGSDEDDDDDDDGEDDEDVADEDDDDDDVEESVGPNTASPLNNNVPHRQWTGKANNQDNDDNGGQTNCKLAKGEEGNEVDYGQRDSLTPSPMPPRSLPSNSGISIQRQTSNTSADSKSFASYKTSSSASSTRESLTTLADSALEIWTNHPRHDDVQKFPSNINVDDGNVRSETNDPRHQRLYNPTLGNPIQFVCLQPEMFDSRLLYPDLFCLPFRKTNSELDLTQIVSKGAHESGEMYGNSIERDSNDALAMYPLEGSGVDQQSSVTALNCLDYGDLVPTTSSLLLSQNSIESSQLAMPTDSVPFHHHRMVTDARFLASKELLCNSANFVHDLTRMQKKYYLAVTERDLSCLVFKRKHRPQLPNDLLTHLKQMLLFGQEVSQLVADQVCNEPSVHDQALIIVSTIQSAILLLHNKNYQSFDSIMRGLTLPQVYRLANAWAIVGLNYPLHLICYRHLITIALIKSKQMLIYPAEPCLPGLTTLITMIKFQLIAIWDRREHPPTKWSTSGNISSWITDNSPLSKEELKSVAKQQAKADMKHKVKQFNRKQSSKSKISLKRLYQLTRVISGRKGKLARLSSTTSRTLWSIKQRSSSTKFNKIYDHEMLYQLISDIRSSLEFDCIDESHDLPPDWARRCSRHIPSQHQMALINDFGQIHKRMMDKIRHYKIVKFI